MSISELVAWLEKTKQQHGDIEVKWDSISHRWPVDPIVRHTEGSAQIPVVVINS